MALRHSKLGAKGSFMHKFVVINVGQTAGSFFMDNLQLAGISCIDELFNPDFICFGRNFLNVFKNAQPIKSRMLTRPRGVAEAFSWLEECQPNGNGHIGLKICGDQADRLPDLLETLLAPDITKVFLRRSNLLNLYLTRLHHARIRKNKETRMSDIAFAANPFSRYNKYLDAGAQNYIFLDIEELFDFRTNSISLLSRRLNVDDFFLKKLSISAIEDTAICRMEDAWSPSDWKDIVLWLEKNMPLDNITEKLVRDCRAVHMNLGFL
jgi:hypothetical protein